MGGAPAPGGLPIRHVKFAKFHYLAIIGIYTFFATRAGWIDYKKYYFTAGVKRLWNNNNNWLIKK